MHAALLSLSRRGGGGRAWVVVSWALAITHLGLLGPRRSLGAANLVTVARANLPALATGRWTSVVMVTGDMLDGRLARRRGEVTVFGCYADSIADAACWTWFAARHEPQPGAAPGGAGRLGGAPGRRRGHQRRARKDGRHPAARGDPPGRRPGRPADRPGPPAAQKPGEGEGAPGRTGA